MRTLSDLRSWAVNAPAGTLIPADTLAELLERVEVAAPAQTEAVAPWRVLLWTAPPECRIGRAELLEAVGRPASWLYRHTGPAAKHRIPHRRLDGELVFVVGEVREWLRERETIEAIGPTDGHLQVHRTPTRKAP